MLRLVHKAKQGHDRRLEDLRECYSGLRKLREETKVSQRTMCVAALVYACAAVLVFFCLVWFSFCCAVCCAVRQDECALDSTSDII